FYKVDMYLSGHDHDMQLIKHPEDVFYQAISGAGGGSRDTSWGMHSLFSETNGGFAAITATSSYAYIEFINRNGEIIFSHTIEKS
ncbi:MAG: hypothetical protein ACK5DT_07020, partial [Ignavibacteria bacterium]